MLFTKKLSGNRKSENRIPLAIAPLESRELLSADIWLNLADLPIARSSADVALLPGGQPVVIGGNLGDVNTPQITALVSRFDPVVNQWTNLASLPEPLAGAGVASGPDGSLLVFGGQEPSNQPSNNLYRYDADANVWTELAAMPSALSDSGSAALSQGRVISIGGENIATGEVFDTVFIYDSHRNSWYTAAPLPSPRTQVEAVSLPNGTVMAIGGRDAAGNSVDDVSIYDPVTNTWSAGTSLPEPRDLGSAVYAGHSMVYYMGGNVTTNHVGNGINQTVYDTVFAYDVRTGVWTTTTSLPEARAEFGAVATSTGVVYAIGGRLSDGSVTGANTLFAGQHSPEAKQVYIQNFVHQVYLDTTGLAPTTQQLVHTTSQIVSGKSTTGEVAGRLLKTDAGLNLTVNDTYLRILGRDANRFELRQWNPLLKQGTITPFQLQQHLLASGEFYNAAGVTNADYVSSLSTVLTGTDDPAVNQKYVDQLDNGVSMAVVAAEWNHRPDSIVYLMDDFSFLYTGSPLTAQQQGNAISRINRGGFGPFGVRNLILGSKDYWNLVRNS